MSSTKPEHNVSHYCQRWLKPWPQVICTENMVKFGRLFFRYVSKQRRTGTLIAIFGTPNGGRVTK